MGYSSNINEQVQNLLRAHSQIPTKTRYGSVAISSQVEHNNK